MALVIAKILSIPIPKHRWCIFEAPLCPDCCFTRWVMDSYPCWAKNVCFTSFKRSGGDCRNTCFKIEIVLINSHLSSAILTLCCCEQTWENVSLAACFCTQNYWSKALGAIFALCEGKVGHCIGNIMLKCDLFQHPPLKISLIVGLGFRLSLPLWFVPP